MWLFQQLSARIFSFHCHYTNHECTCWVEAGICILHTLCSTDLLCEMPWCHWIDHSTCSWNWTSDALRVKFWFTVHLTETLLPFNQIPNGSQHRVNGAKCSRIHVAPLQTPTHGSYWDWRPASVHPPRALFLHSGLFEGGNILSWAYTHASAVWSPGPHTHIHMVMEFHCPVQVTAGGWTKWHQWTNGPVVTRYCGLGAGEKDEPRYELSSAAKDCDSKLARSVMCYRRRLVLLHWLCCVWEELLLFQ